MLVKWGAWAISAATSLVTDAARDGEILPSSSAYTSSSPTLRTTCANTIRPSAQIATVGCVGALQLPAHKRSSVRTAIGASASISKPTRISL